MQNAQEESRWYAVHTYSGYEKKVKESIKKIVENRGLRDQIDEIMIPTRKTLEMRNGVRREVERKILPGYVLIKMIMNDDTWYLVRNTRGVTSFVGPGSKPIPLEDSEMAMFGVGEQTPELDIEPEQLVKIISGAFEGSIGTVEEVNHQKRSVKIRLTIFNQDTSAEVDYHTLQKI